MASNMNYFFLKLNPHYFYILFNIFEGYTLVVVWDLCTSVCMLVCVIVW